MTLHFIVPLLVSAVLMLLCFNPYALFSAGALRRVLTSEVGMLFQRINRSDAETVFAIFYNVAGATITANYAGVWDTATADGVRVTKPATATLSLFVGLANKDIADSSYGLFQNYGYRASGFVTNGTSQAISAGDILIPVNAQHYLAWSAASDGKSGFVYAGESFATATTPAAATKKVFIRGL
jgi:hypothetical protein